VESVNFVNFVNIPATNPEI